MRSPMRSPISTSRGSKIAVAAVEEDHLPVAGIEHGLERAPSTGGAPPVWINTSPYMSGLSAGRDWRSRAAP